MHHLEVRRLASAYGSHQVLHDLSLTIAKGQVVSLIGPSGSGKSTVLRVLMGLTSATAGEVLIDGERVDYRSRRSLRSARDRMAIVFQQYNLFQNMSALANVTITPDPVATGCAVAGTPIRVTVAYDYANIFSNLLGSAGVRLTNQATMVAFGADMGG